VQPPIIAREGSVKISSQNRRIPTLGFSTVEVIVVMCIVGILAGIFFVTMVGTKTGDHIDRAVQEIYNDLLLIRSRSVSTNRDHRINFTSSTQWNLQSYDSTNGNWEAVGETRTMPTDVMLKDGTGAGTLQNAGSNLQSSPRGLFTFLNNAQGEPFVTIKAFGTSKTKSLYVYVGGAIELKTP
jgi:Tfp pilus assembly protein FimT